MATENGFPKTRHLALVMAEGPQAAADGQARSEGGTALVVPIEQLPASAASVAEPTPAAAEELTAPLPGALASAAPPTVPALTAGAPEAAKAATGSTPPSAAPPASAAPSRLPRAAQAELSRPQRAEEACLDEEGNRAGGAEPVRCPSSLSGRGHASESAARAARGAEAALLAGLDRWYRLGSAGAGHCQNCELALVEALRSTYGEHVLPFPALHLGSAANLPPRERPFAGLREALRLREPLDAAKRAILHARDEARRVRGLELAVLGRVGPLSALSLELCKHLDGLVFELPSLDPLESLFPLLCARAALGERAAVALLPAQARQGQVRLFAALAAACDTDLALAEGASAEARAALAADRRYQALVRERYRPSTPLSDVEIYLSPRGDHWSEGKHLRSSGLLAAVLARGQLMTSVRLEGSPPLQGKPVLALAGCSWLPEELAAPLRRQVEGGGDLLLVGPCSLIDEEGRDRGPLFPDLKQGLDRVGEGRIHAIAPTGELPAPAQLEPLLLRAARELVGRGKQTLNLLGRGQLLARAYLDPERKLDVHLVNLDLRPESEGGGFGPAQGLLLHIAGQAAGGGRSGYWFAPERQGGRDGERISLNPSGFSVSTVLPSIGATALLAVPR